MKKLAYIFFAISLLLFSCKAMDYAVVKDEDNFVSIQYYNFKPTEITYLNFVDILDSHIPQFKVQKDTLILDFTFDPKLKKVIIGNDTVFEPRPTVSRCRNTSVLIIDGYKIRTLKKEIAASNDFYQVCFPILEVENVERKDLGKWYRSFSTIVVNVEQWNYSQQFTFTYPRSFLSASNYTRP